jgi:hypothetical protein
MTPRLLKLGGVKADIRRPDGPVVDALFRVGLIVVVIPPTQVKNPRGRYRSVSQKYDRIDAYLLSGVVPTDQRRLRRETAQTTTVQGRQDLVAHLATVANHPPEPPQAPRLAAPLDAARRRAQLDPVGTERTPAHFRRLLVRQGHLGRVTPHLFTVSHPHLDGRGWSPSPAMVSPAGESRRRSRRGRILWACRRRAGKPSPSRCSSYLTQGCPLQRRVTARCAMLCSAGAAC